LQPAPLFDRGTLKTVGEGPERMLLGLDSTDSVHGGCTTHVALEVWRRLASYGVRGGPRLVRLNPNVPYKTRGNGALCLDLGHGVGHPRRAAVARGVDLWAYAEIQEPSEREAQEIFETARDVIGSLRSDGSNTGLVILSNPPAASVYEAAVAGHVASPGPVAGARVATWGNGRGLLGAVAAAAWPARRGSYELIAYREPSRRGTKRALSLEIGRELDAKAPNSFDNWDPEHGHLRVAPASPCPILAGVRGTDAPELTGVLPLLDAEPIESWALFVTNQGSGDHLQPRPLGSLRRFDAALVRAHVRGDPQTKPGGHVFVPIEQDGAQAIAAAYEPTKGLRAAARTLREGDVVMLEAAIHEDPRILALEALQVVAPTPRRAVVTRCECGGAAPSKGRRSKPVCARCGHEGLQALRQEPRDLGGRVTAPACVRRHLATPPGIAPERLVLPMGGIAA
jgi:tRNA(Ile2)-agmatinylcytidine synthase